MTTAFCPYRKSTNLPLANFTLWFKGTIQYCASYMHTRSHACHMTYGRGVPAERGWRWRRGWSRWRWTCWPSCPCRRSIWSWLPDSSWQQGGLDTSPDGTNTNEIPLLITEMFQTPKVLHKSLPSYEVTPSNHDTLVLRDAWVRTAYLISPTFEILKIFIKPQKIISGAATNLDLSHRLLWEVACDQINRFHCQLDSDCFFKLVRRHKEHCRETCHSVYWAHYLQAHIGFQPLQVH